jgi:hypothetical protein
MSDDYDDTYGEGPQEPRREVEPHPAAVEHISVTTNHGRTQGDCSICGMGIDVPPTFGFIPGETLLFEWAKQHAHEPKAAK